MTVSMDDLLDLRRHLNTSHSCICVGSDPTPATVARTSSVSHLRHSSTVFRHASMLILSAQSSHVELAFLCHFAPTLSPFQRLAAHPSHLLALAPSPSQHATSTGSGAPEGESHEISMLTRTSDDPPPLSSSHQSDGCVAVPRTGPHGQEFLDVLTCVSMRLPSTLSCLASPRIFG